MPTFATRDMAGWGRFPVQSCRVARPEKWRELLETARQRETPDMIARGLGRSYGDAALNQDSGVVLTEKLGHFLDFDTQSGVLHAQGGACFADIIQTFAPRGWFLPVVPGTKFVTLGGAIACDVHGKNHRQKGSLGQYIQEIELLTASGDVLTLSPAYPDPAEDFWATVGGMGLTGIILSAKIQLVPIQTTCIRTTYKRTTDLDSTLAEFEAHPDVEFPVAWLDCLASGANLGRGVWMGGDYASVSEVGSDNPLDLPAPKKRAIPLDFPDFALSPLSVRAFNAVYYASHADGQKTVPFEPFFWPLDAVAGWNKIYGARGFVQYQCALPLEMARDGLKTLLEMLSSSGRAPFLAVLKVFGQSNPAPLSFPTPGYCLALDLPATEGIVEFAQTLDEIALRHSGRVYLAKDATLSPAHFRRMYPRVDQFEAVKARLDPDHRFASSLSKRLNIGGAR